MFLTTVGSTSLFPACHFKRSNSVSGQSRSLQLHLGLSPLVGGHQSSQPSTSHLNTAGQRTVAQVTGLVKLEQWLCQTAKPSKFPGKRAAGCAAGKLRNPSCLLLHRLPGAHHRGQVRLQSAFQSSKHDGAVRAHSPPALSPAWVTDAVTLDR